MKPTLNNPIVVAVLGVGLSLLAVAGIALGLLKPTQDKTAAAQARYDAAYPDSTPEAQKKAKKDLDAAKQKVALIQGLWAQKDAALMPRFDVGGTLPADRFRALHQLTYELTQYLGPDIERQLKTTGIRTANKVSLPSPPVNPNQITDAPIVIPLGAITVNGDFRAILTHFYDWQYFNRLVLVDALALHGSSPYMQGTYNATLYIFPQNSANKVAPLIPAAGAGTAGAPGRGGPGGYPGGSGGYPGGAPLGSPGGPPGR